MTATAHPGPRHHRSGAETTIRALHILRAMAPLRAVDGESEAPQFRVNWGVVVTNAIGAVLGLMLTASAGGLAFLVWRLPAQQDQLLRNQEGAKSTLLELVTEVKRLDQNDRVQDNRLERLEGGR